VPLSINQSEPTGTYVCSPHTAYIRYAREETDDLAGPAIRPAAARADRNVRPSAPGSHRRHRPPQQLAALDQSCRRLDVEDGQALAKDLAASFARSLLALRSLNNVAHACLIERLQAGDWVLLPSRQIYLIADIERDWRPRARRPP